MLPWQICGAYSSSGMLIIWTFTVRLHGWNLHVTKLVLVARAQSNDRATCFQLFEAQEFSPASWLMLKGLLSGSQVSRAARGSCVHVRSSRAPLRTMASNSNAISGKNVAVVGASRGIGLEFVRQLLAKGNTVHATARKPDASKGLQDLKRNNESLSLATLDVANPNSISAWAASLQGRKQFDYLFNIAGVMDPSRSDLQNIDSAKMLNCFQINTIGPLLVVQHLLEKGLLAKGSTIGNMTSKMGSVADNSSGRSYAYRASKAALNQVTKSMSIDLESRDMTCVVLHPGWVRTDMTGGSGLIDVDQSVSGLISLLEKYGHELNGRFFDYKHEEIPW